jgi:hypothetical protein
MVITTSVLTGPFLIDFTVPAIWFRALIFMAFTKPYCMYQLINPLAAGAVAARTLLQD